jgi:hypothetical protein
MRTVARTEHPSRMQVRTCVRCAVFSRFIDILCPSALALSSQILHFMKELVNFKVRGLAWHVESGRGTARWDVDSGGPEQFGPLILREIFQSSPLPTFPFLVAVQTKHHRNRNWKTGPSPVREFQALIQKQPFQAGLLVTNTSFTANARWEGEHRAHLVRLRDFEDLTRWIVGDFLDSAESREIPDFIEYAPGRRIWIPRPAR